MQYAKITNGLVERIVLADAAFVAALPGVWQACPDGVGIGHAFDGAAFHAPATVVTADPCQWLVDIGPFYDRFGAAKMPVLTSTDPALKAILADVNIRKWVDLQRVDVAQALAYAGSVVPAVTTTLRAAILTTPVVAEESRALRKLYFS